ncbi:MAG: hypothetical protein OEY52_11365 [Gammaproteobacteria bacterium]|nr:hypothetical protein [Gammaproteobacteria bacterium]
MKNLFNGMRGSFVNPVILSVAVVMSSAGCSDDPKPATSRTVGVKAQVADSANYTVAARQTFLQQMLAFVTGKNTYAISGSTIDQVVALPHDRGDIYPNMLAEAVVANLNADGSFNLTLRAGYDWLILLKNSKAATKEESIVAYVTATAASDSTTMVDMPITKATGNIDLGELIQNPANKEEVKSADGKITDVSAKFNMTAEQLAEMGKQDDAFKNLMNAYLNYESGKFYMPSTQFNWDGTGFSGLKNAYGLPANYTFNGYFIYMRTVSSEVNLDAICGNSVEMSMEPPVGTSVTDGTTTWTSSSPFYTDTMAMLSDGSCMDTDKDFSVAPGTNGETRLGFPTVSVAKGNPAAGWWYLKKDGATIARFDFEVARPADDSGKPLVYIPVPRISTDGNGKVSSVDIKWFRYDTATTNHVEITDYKVIDTLMTHSFVEVTDMIGTTNSNTSEERELSNKTTGAMKTVSFTKSWYASDAPSVTNAGSNPILEQMKIGYRVGGLDYAYNWKHGL